jgi:hypothetical protein
MTSLTSPIQYDNQYHKAKAALMALGNIEELPESIRRAIITLDALQFETKVDDQGRPLNNSGKPMAWKRLI